MISKKSTINVVTFLSVNFALLSCVLCGGYNFNIFHIRSMADERKSLFKHPYQHRRSRKLTPDLFTPYLPGPELIPPSPMSVNQTIPIFSVSGSLIT